MARKVKIRVKARHGDDPARIFGVINREFSNDDLDVSYDGRSDPPDDSRKRPAKAIAPVPKPPVPDEPRETETLAKTNEMLAERRERMRAQGVDPDVRMQADAAERLEKRRRLKGFGQWLRDRLGTATITVLMSSIKEWAKSKLGL